MDGCGKTNRPVPPETNNPDFDDDECAELP